MADVNQVVSHLNEAIKHLISVGEVWEDLGETDYAEVESVYPLNKDFFELVEDFIRWRNGLEKDPS